MSVEENEIAIKVLSSQPDNSKYRHHTFFLYALLKAHPETRAAAEALLVERLEYLQGQPADHAQELLTMIRTNALPENA